MGSSAFLLPLEPRGLYREMLTQAWRRGARLPKDPASIQRATGVTAEEWGRCWPSISQYWRVEGDSLVNDTQLEVYAETRTRYERESTRGSKAGRASGRARAERKTDTRSTHVATHVEPVSNPPSPSPSPDRERTARGQAFVGKRIRVPAFLHDDLCRLKGRVEFDLFGWYPQLDAELEASGEPIADEIAFVRERFYRAAGIARPNLFGRKRSAPSSDPPVPSIEETEAKIAEWRVEIPAEERQRGKEAMFAAYRAGLEKLGRI